MAAMPLYRLQPGVAAAQLSSGEYLSQFNREGEDADNAANQALVAAGAVAVVASGAPPSAGGGDVSRLTGAWQPFLLAHAAGPRSVLCAQDRAAEYDPTSNTTFVSYLGPDRALFLLAFDHATSKASPPVFVASYPSNPGIEDDHGVPSMTIDSAGYINVVYGAHVSAPVLARSKQPRSITSGFTVTTAPNALVGTYHSLASVGTSIYALFRPGANHGSSYPAHEFGGLARSTDGMATWTDIGPIVDLTGYSGEAAKDFYLGAFDADTAGKLHLSWCVAHGASHDAARSDVFHAVYDPATSKCYTAAGVDLGASVAGSADLVACRVKASGRTNIPRHAITPTGKIAMTWAELPTAPNLTDTFTDAAAKPENIEAHTENGITWAKAYGFPDTLQIGADGMVFGTGTGNFASYVASPVPASPDQFIEADVKIKSVQGLAILRIRAQDAQSSRAAYGAEISGTTLRLLRLTADGSAATELANVACVLDSSTVGKTAVFRYEATGLTVTATVKIDGTTVATATFTETTGAAITASGQVGMRLRNSDATSGFNVDAVRFTGSAGAIGTSVAYFNGTGWTVSDLGARTRHMFSQPGVRATEDGGFEAFAPSGRQDEGLILHPLEEAISYVNIGCDFKLYTSPDGTAWTDKGIIVRRGDVRGQGVNGIVVPRNATTALKGIAVPGSVSGGLSGGLPTNRLPLYGVSDVNVNPVLAGQTGSQPTVEAINPIVVLSNTAVPSAFTWQTLNLAAYLPANTTRVLLRAFCRGSGTAGRWLVQLRQNGVSRGFDIEASGRGEWGNTSADEALNDLWVPVGRDKIVQWQIAGQVSQIGFYLIAFEID